MGTKEETDLDLETQYKTKTDMQTATTELRTAKALAPSQELVEATLLSIELPKAISKDSQSQLIE